MHLWLGVLIIALSQLVYAQDEVPENLDSSSASAQPAPPADQETSDIDEALERGINRPKDEAAVEQEVEIKQLPEVKDVSGLARLSQFEDIAVIQRRFLPKSNRLEIFPNLGFIINDAFFTNAVMSGRIGYNFIESMGLEANVMILGTSERQVTRDLNEKRGVTTRSLVTAQSYYGLDFKWSPVYGKMGSFNTSIVPFDMYFSFGAGNTKTNQGQNAVTFHIGTGQIFALAKWAAFRWDLSWYRYTAQATTGATSTFLNIYAMMGVSLFIPEAKYR